MYRWVLRIAFALDGIALLRLNRELTIGFLLDNLTAGLATTIGPGDWRTR